MRELTVLGTVTASLRSQRNSILAMIIYTHTGIVRGMHDDNRDERTRVRLRKVGKWWETEGKRTRYDKDGYEKDHWQLKGWGLESRWRLEVESIEREL